MPELSEATKTLIAKYAEWKRSLKPKDGVKTLHVDEVALKVAAFYEHIRTIIDWKEEHLMRRAAIIRKLKRRFIDLELHNFATENIAEPLVLELIRGGHFPNDKIEESKITDVQKILSKYIFILKNSPENKQGKAGLQFHTRLLEIAACEVEETLAPPIKEMALIEYMFGEMQNRIKVHEKVYAQGKLKKEETDTQVYIAMQQALFKFDNPIISYNLLRYTYPQWDDPSEEELFKLSQNIATILRTIDQAIYHPLAKKFYAICEKYDTPYLLLGDVLAKHDLETVVKDIANPSALEAFIKGAYQARLADLKKKIARAAIYSTASIFITKILSLVILEIALARIFKGHLNVIALLADVLIPTILMALLVLWAKPPSAKNLAIVVMETIKIVYKKDAHDVYEIKPARKRSVATRAVLALFYLAGAAISFGFLIWTFTYFNFPVISIAINLLFIALILFAGTAIQQRSKELTIEEEAEGFLGFISDILFLPIAGVGRWLSHTWRQYNAITAFFNALIDMPFSAFVEFIERWRYFIKDRKEDLR